MRQESWVSRVRAARKASTPPAHCLPYFCFPFSSLSAFSLLPTSCFSGFSLFSLPHSHYLPLSVLFICSPSQASICPLAAINQRRMEVPARPVRASAVSGRELQACPVATHSLCHPSAHQAAHPAVQQGSTCSHINLLHFTFFNILNAFASQLHRYSQDHPQSRPLPLQGIFPTLGRARERGSTTGRLSWDFPPSSAEPADPQLVMLADMSETVTPPAQLPCSS